MEKFRHEQGVEINKFNELNKFFGENFNLRKTLELEEDVDKDNKKVELNGIKAYWTELINPDTNEVVEAKVYMSENGEANEIVIVSPGYKGDFVLQENEYAESLVNEERVLLVLRHNGLRIAGKEEKNYVHCPDKQEFAEKERQEYLGKGDDFNFIEADKEVLTALKAMENKIKNINKIDIIGHSWGGRIALNSILKLKKEGGNEEILEKIDNLVLLGAWLETRKENIEPAFPFFKAEEEAGYFKNMDAKKTIDQILKSGEKLKEVSSEDLPRELRIVGIHSVEDKDIDLEGETMEFFKQIKEQRRKGSIVLKDLVNLLPKKIGDRNTEVHDYAVKEVREWIEKIIE